MKNEDKELPGLERIKVDHETRWFTSNSCVIHHENISEVFVGGLLVGRYGPKEIYMRNLLLIGLSEDSRIKRGKLAWAFGVSAERLRQLRQLVETEGVDSLPGRPRGGSSPKTNDKKKV